MRISSIVIHACIIAIQSVTGPVNILQCNGGAQGSDNAFEEIKYIGSPGWPKALTKPFNCEWEISVNKYDRGKFLKISFIDFKTACTKRSRLWLKEGGIQKLNRVCGKNEIPDYISRSGRVTVGIDFGDDAQALISYQAVKPRQASVIPQEIARLKMAAKSMPDELYSDYSLNDVVKAHEAREGQISRTQEIANYDYYKPTAKPRRNNARIAYRPPQPHPQRKIYPTQAFIKIAHPPPPPVDYRQQPVQPSNINRETAIADKEALGMRNILLTCIFGALGVIFLCAVIYLARRFLIKVESDKLAVAKMEFEALRQIQVAEDNKFNAAQQRYESQTKLKASYKDRKL